MAAKRHDFEKHAKRDHQPLKRDKERRGISHGILRSAEGADVVEHAKFSWKRMAT